MRLVAVLVPWWAPLAFVSDGLTDRVSGPQASTPASIRIPIVGAAAIRGGISLEPAVRTSRGDLVVSRRELAAVEVYDRRGRLVGRLPRRGDNVLALPPIALDMLPGDTLVLLDRRSRTLALYALVQGREPELTRRISLLRQYDDLCALQGRVALLSSVSGSIDMLDVGRSKVSHTWSTLPRLESSVARGPRNARLVCNPSREQVYVVGMTTPRLRAFDRTGSLVWARLLSFPQPRHSSGSSRNSGRVVATADYALVRAVLIDPSSLLVQFRPVLPDHERWGQDGPLLSILLATTSGREIWRGTTTALVLAADATGLLVFDAPSGSVIRVDRSQLNGRQ